MTVEHIIGDEPLRDGMKLSVRSRQDFTVADAEALLAAARRVYVALHPGSTAQDAQDAVSSAADVMFQLLEMVSAPERLHMWQGYGLSVEGQRSHVVVDEPRPLPAGLLAQCGREDDVFALPPGRDD